MMYKFAVKDTQTHKWDESPARATTSIPSGLSDPKSFSSAAKPRNFYQRLFPELKASEDVAALRTPQSLPEQRRGPQASTFFQKLKSGFDQPQHETWRGRKYMAAGEEPGSSTLSAPESPMVTELKDSYIQTAKQLHEKVFIGLATAHAELEQRLGAMTTDDAALITAADRNVRTLARPLGAFRMMFAECYSRTGTRKTRHVHIGDLVADASRALATAETELARLWAEWEAAQAEVDAAAHDIVTILGVAEKDGGKDGHGHPSVMSSEASDGLEAFASDVEALGEELSGLVDGTVEKMRDCEKVHRRSILADVQIWFASING